MSRLKTGSPGGDKSLKKGALQAPEAAAAPPPLGAAAARLSVREPVAPRALLDRNVDDLDAASWRLLSSWRCARWMLTTPPWTLLSAPV